MSGSAAREEIARIRRVADMLCSGHAVLRDRYAHLGLLLDMSILLISIWLVALSFVAPPMSVALTPTAFSPQLWLGLLAVIAFFLSILQLKVDWKGRADAHKRSMDIYSDVKREAGYLFGIDPLPESDYRRLMSKYEVAAATAITIPEREFLRQKRNHLTKIALSKHLDLHPSASIWILRVRFWFRDTFNRYPRVKDEE
jgi:hypothetical protein